MSKQPSVLLRCDASGRLGFGHLVRCVALAEEFRQCSGYQVCFALAEDAVGHARVRETGFPLVAMPRAGTSRSRWMEGVVRAERPHAVIFDVRDGTRPEELQQLREIGVLVVAIDDTSSRRLSADMVFYPPVPQVRKLPWDGFNGERYVGWEWAVVRRQFRNAPERRSAPDLRVLVTMGGSDPEGLTLLAVEALDSLANEFTGVIALGSAFSHRGALERRLSGARRRYEVHEDVKDMAGLMAGVDVAVASFGVTAYELAAVGVPAIYLCLSPDHAESANAFVEAGIAASMGVHSLVRTSEVALALAELLANHARRSAMAARARAAVDGRGAERVALQVSQRLEFSNG